MIFFYRTDHKDDQKKIWETLFTNANTAHAGKKSLSLSTATICLGASLIAIFSGYANWPLSIEAIDSRAENRGIPESFWVDACGQLVGATGFFVLAALNGIGSFETFQQIIHGLSTVPQSLKSLPNRTKNYFTSCSSVTEKVAPIAKLALNGLALYGTVSAPLNLMTITSMETTGWWEKFLQGCVIVGTTSTSWFCFSNLTDGVYNYLFSSKIDRKRQKLQSLLKDLKNHVSHLTAPSVEIIWTALEFSSSRAGVNPS